MDEIIKDTKNNGRLIIKEIDYKTSKHMMITNHYSKKWNSGFGKINIGIFKGDRLLGCAAFGNMMNPKSGKTICDEPNSVIELNRMWIDDELKKNSETVLLGASFKLLKTINPDIKFIQSFADGRLGCGTIYKAANFKYFGFNKSLFFEDTETGEIFHKVPLENTKRPFGFLIKNRRYIDGKLNAFYVKTYRYIYPLYKNKYKIKLSEMPYPEYEKGIEKIKHNHSIGLLCRLFLMYKAIKDKEYADKTFSILQQNFSSNDIITELENQKENKSYIWFITEYLNNDSNLKKLTP
jgi:hypothetical protein